jgi:hypothetical protein
VNKNQQIRVRRLPNLVLKPKKLKSRISKNRLVNKRLPHSRQNKMLLANSNNKSLNKRE